MRVGFSAPPWLFYPKERDLLPIVQEIVCVSGPIWMGAESLASPPGFSPRTEQPVVSRCANSSVLAQYSL
jgi:hypothetical protein